MNQSLRFVLAIAIAAALHQSVQSQSLGINSTGSPAHNSAMLDVESTTKGMLIPRMNKTQKNGIASPATGLLIFQNAPDSIGFYYYSGSAWVWLSSSVNAWSTTGNAGTTPVSNFLGTTDNNALVFRTNNAEGMRLTTNGELGIGTSTPNSTYGYARLELASEGFGAPTDLLIRNAVNDAGYAPGVIIQHARGTLAAPLSVINGDYQAAFTTMNYDGSSYIQSAAIDVYTDGPVSTNKVSSRINFATRDTAGNFAYRMTLKSNGKLGIGTTNPSALTHISDGNLLVSGTLGSSPAIEFSGAGSKMFFYPRKSAIRAGYVTGTQWDDVNIGNFSVGLGANSLAKSDNSISIGEANTADVNPFAIAIGRQNYSGGFASLAMGHFSQATGHYSSSIGLRDTVSGYGASALGGYNTVGGTHAFAAGLSNTVNGDAATALGSSNYAPSYGETTIGHFATQYSALNANGINSADRLFTIGNGTGPGSRSDAMVMLKSGFTGLGTSTPNSTLQVDGTIAVGITMGIAGGPVGTPTLISTQKAYLGLSPAGANTYYQLPDPTLTPGRIYYIRNNDNTNSAWLGTVAGLLCPGSGTCLASGTWYELKATISVKSVMVISDGVNWSVFKMD